MLNFWCNLPKCQRDWSRGKQPVLSSSCPALPCPVLSFSCHVMSNIGRTLKHPAWLGLPRPALSPEVFVLLTEINVSDGSQHISPSRLESRLARKLLMGSIDVQKLFALKKKCWGRARVCTLHMMTFFKEQKNIEKLVRCNFYTFWLFNLFCICICQKKCEEIRFGV